jgi:hypothetical protein
LFILRDIPILLLDKNGRMIGVAVPPRSNKDETDNMMAQLQKLRQYGKPCSESKRGAFEVLECGLQFGGGSKVAGPRNSGPSKDETTARKAADEFFSKSSTHNFCSRAAGK